MNNGCRTLCSSKDEGEVAVWLPWEHVAMRTFDSIVLELSFLGDPKKDIKYLDAPLRKIIKTPPRNRQIW